MGKALCLHRGSVAASGHPRAVMLMHVVLSAMLLVGRHSQTCLLVHGIYLLSRSAARLSCEL